MKGLASSLLTACLPCWRTYNGIAPTERLENRPARNALHPIPRDTEWGRAFCGARFFSRIRYTGAVHAVTQPDRAVATGRRTLALCVSKSGEHGRGPALLERARVFLSILSPAAPAPANDTGGPSRPSPRRLARRNGLKLGIAHAGEVCRVDHDLHAPGLALASLLQGGDFGRDLGDFQAI